MLLGILQQRIELDKECMFQFTQLRKEVDIILLTREDINNFLFSGARGRRADKHRACLDALSEGMSTGQSYQSWQIVIRVIR